MKAYIPGVDPNLDIEGKLKELGHKPLMLEQSANRTGSEGSATFAM